jgi:hypothetical protein
MPDNRSFLSDQGSNQSDGLESNYGSRSSRKDITTSR